MTPLPAALPPSSRQQGVSAKTLLAAALDWRAWAFAATVLFAFLLIRFGIQEDLIGFDFRGTIWDAAHAIRDGRSPYPAPVVAEVDVGNPALYPPLLMLAAVPLTLLPWWLGFAVWTVVLAAAVAATLYILNVRDPRCYLIALLSMPALGDVIVGNATLLLVPLVALAWRWRDQWLRAGIVVGLAIASKLFLWPLLVWLLATRRYRAFAAAVVATFASVLIPWALIGFDGIRSYPDLLRMAEGIYATHSYSVATIFSALGADDLVASRGALALGVAIAALAFMVGRRRADSVSLSIALMAAILGSPILWAYYYALLLVPIALAHRRFSPLWAAFGLFYIAGVLPAGDYVEGSACCRPDDVPEKVWQFNHSSPGLWPALASVAVAVLLVAVSVRSLQRTEATS